MSWKAFDETKQIWIARYYVPSFQVNSVILKSKNGDPLLISPGKSLADCALPEIFENKLPTLALAPNYFHFMGYTRWKEIYPHLILSAAPETHRRLRKKRISTESLELFRQALPENMSLLKPEGLRAGEIWIRVQQENGVIWIVGDAFLNYARFSNRPLARFMQKIMRAAPGLKISSVIKYLLIKNRKRYKNWLLNQLKTDQPTTLIPLHGEVLQSPQLPVEIQKIVEKRL